MHPTLTFEFAAMDGKARMKELILYISDKCTADPTFGATKLNKILFYTDFTSFARYGEPVSGVEYQKLPQGPAPKQLVPVRDAMQESGELAIKQTQYFARTQNRPVSLREADLAQFSGRDIAMVDQIIDLLWGKTAREVSEMSHRRAWRITHDQESIPYEAVYLSDEDCSPQDVARIAELNREHHWE